MNYTTFSSDGVSNKITAQHGRQYHHAFEEGEIINDALKSFDFCRF